MKHKLSTFCKVASIITMANVIAVMLLCHTVFASSEKARGLYFKVFNQTELPLKADYVNADNVVGVSCDTYNDHPALSYDGEILPPGELLPPQHDMIFGVSALCPAHMEGHYDPIIHINGEEGDYFATEPITDALDGCYDDFHASVTCVDAEGIYPNLVPKRIVLECLDHDAIIAEGKKVRVQ